MTGTESERFQFVENMGLLFERSGASRTLGRVFGYLLLSGEPKTLDEIAEGLLFSKATASLTVRQGLFLHFFEKISIPGEQRITTRLMPVSGSARCPKRSILSRNGRSWLKRDLA